MDDNKIIKVAACGFVGLVVVPAVLGAGLRLVAGACNLVEKAKFKKKIKNGLKDGSIIEIDGQYYEVEVQDVEEA